MAIEGELSGTEGVTCDCGVKLELAVQMSAAGHYLGYFCNQCGPWSRETGYFKNRKEAEKALEGRGAGHLRDTGYKRATP